MRKIRSFILFVLLLPVSFAGNTFNDLSAAHPDMEIIRERVVGELLRHTLFDDEIKALMTHLTTEGYWADIDYEDLSRTAFENSKHTSRLIELSSAWRNPSSSFFRDEALLNNIESALTFWIIHDFICENWWHNEIGTPNNLVNTLLLVGDALPSVLVQKTRPIIGRAHLEAEGARPSGDRIKIADIFARNMLFFGDEERFGEGVKVIGEEIKFETGRGMQNDYSFHHRTDRVNNTLSYGLQSADVFAIWVEYVSETRYAFSEEKVKLLVDYYLDGVCKMMPLITLSDPGRELESLSFTLSSKVQDRPDMKSVWDEVRKISRITVKLPTGSYAGESKIIYL